MVLSHEQIHPGEAWDDLCTTSIVQSAAAICLRLLASDGVPYGSGEALLRRLADISETSPAGPQPPAISMSRDGCHPCHDLSELLTCEDSVGGGSRRCLAGRSMLFTWTRGERDASASPTQDSLMMMTRMSMRVTLCHPRGRELDADVIRTCDASTRGSGGEFRVTDDLEQARRGQDVVYARHWGVPAMGEDVANWYCDKRRLGPASYVHPMPVDRGVEAPAEVVDESRSFTRELVRNRYFVQKAVLARLGWR